MTKSKNIDVQHFLDGIELIDHDKYELLNAMRDIVFKIYPRVQERMMYGGIMFSYDKNDFGGLFIRKNHISFEFARGYLMKDPKKLLEGSGKFRRHLKIGTLENVKSTDVRFFVKQAL